MVEWLQPTAQYSAVGYLGLAATNLTPCTEPNVDDFVHSSKFLPLVRIGFLSISPMGAFLDLLLSPATCCFEDSMAMPNARVWSLIAQIIDRKRTRVDVVVRTRSVGLRATLLWSLLYSTA